MTLTPRPMTCVSARPVWLFLLAATALAASCTPARPRLGQLPGSERDSIRVNPGRATSSAREVVEKRVGSKRPTSMLVATDESWCTVSHEQFAATNIGDYVRCAWTAGLTR